MNTDRRHDVAIVHGEFRTLDLTRLGYPRVARNEPYAEAGIV